MSEIIEVNEDKNTVLKVEHEELDKYMSDFDGVISNLDSEISDLTGEIEKINDDIKATSEKLRNTIEEFNNKEKEEKEKIKNSDDYTPESLIESAKKLDELAEEKSKLEADLKSKIDDFNQKASELESKKALREKVKNIVQDITTHTSEEISSIMIEAKKKLEAINAALEVCDNPHLKEALTEEKNNMEKSLEEMKNSKFGEVKKAIEALEDSSEEKEIKTEIEVPEKTEIKPVEVAKIEAPEPKIEIEYENPEIIKETSVEDEVVTKVEEIFVDKDREIIQIDSVEEDKIDQIKNSSVIKDGIKGFFQLINSGVILTPEKKDEAGKLKTIEDENVINASQEDQVYIGADIYSQGSVDVYSSINDLVTRFNPQRKKVSSNIESIILLDNGQIANISSTYGTILSELKYSSGMNDKNSDAVIKIEDGYILYTPYGYEINDKNEKRKESGDIEWKIR